MDKERQKYLHSQIPLLIAELNKRLIEREELSPLVILVMLSKSNMFLMGERGVGKSKTVELINGAINGAIFWQLQVNADTKHEELFGAKTKTQEGTLSYVAKRSVLNAHYVVLDEMFKAKSKRLNSLLELLVDRSYTSGDGIKRDAPLLACFGTSNEYPTETYMLPYVDRFDFWYEVKRIEKEENRLRYYAGDYDQSPIVEQYISLEDIEHINQMKNKIMIPNFIIELFHAITTSLITQKVKTSDRKYARVLHNTMKVSAYLNNRDYIDISDLFLLLHSAWHDESEKYKVQRVVFEEIFGNKETTQALILEIEQTIETIDTEKNKSIYGYLDYKEKLDSIDNQSIFLNVKRFARDCLNAYMQQKKSLKLLIDKFEDNLRIEKLIEQNIFISNYKQNAFTEDMIASIEMHIDKVEKKIYNLSEWMQCNETLFDYQNNRLQNSKGNSNGY